MRKLLLWLIPVTAIGYLIVKGTEAANQVSYKIKGYGSPSVKFPFVTIPVTVEFNNPLPASIPIEKFIAVISYKNGDTFQNGGTITQDNFELPPGKNTIVVDATISVADLSKNLFQTISTVLKKKLITVKTDATVTIKGVQANQSFTTDLELPTTLGLVPAADRKVRPMPASLRNLVPPPTGENENVKSADADPIYDTVPFIRKVVGRTLYQTKKLAAKLKGNSTLETARNDFNFIYDYIRYKLDDSGIEQVRSPRRLIYEAAGDCDCFATLLSSLLTNQGIDHSLRVAAYNGNDWTHIYVIVPYRGSYITLDPVTNEFNYEVKPSATKDFKA